MHNLHSHAPSCPKSFALTWKSPSSQEKVQSWAICLTSKQDSSLTARLLGHFHDLCALKGTGKLTKQKEARVLSSAKHHQQPQNLKTISNVLALKNQAYEDEQSKLQNHKKANCQEIVIKVLGLQ